MSQTQVIQTTTVVEYGIAQVDIRSFYEDTGGSLFCFLAEDVGTVDLIDYVEGDGIVVCPPFITAYVDTDGHLIIDDTAGDESRFWIDELTGHLMENI